MKYLEFVPPTIQPQMVANIVRGPKVKPEDLPEFWSAQCELHLDEHLIVALEARPYWMILGGKDILKIFMKWSVVRPRDPRDTLFDPAGILAEG